MISKERIAALQTKADKLNEDISKLGYLTEGNVITSVSPKLGRAICYYL